MASSAAADPAAAPSARSIPDDAAGSAEALPAQQLAGRRVRSSDGRRLGVVRDVYLGDRDGAVRAISVVPGRLRTRAVLVPWGAVAAVGQREEISLALGSETFGRAVPAPATGHASPELLRQAGAALALEPSGRADGEAGRADGEAGRA